MAWKNFELSLTSAATLVNVETYTGKPPLATPVEYPVTVETSSGLVREHGGAVCEWTFAALTEAQFDALRAVITAKSAACWVRTIMENKFDYGYYTGIVIWPSRDEIDRRMSPKFSTAQFILRFRNLVRYTP
jgi:hypothetical protein